MSDTTTDLEPPPAPDAPGVEPHLGWVVAGLSAGAGVIHLAMVPIHGGAGLTDPLGFAVVGWFQLAIAALILMGRDGKRTYQAAVAGNLVFIGLWVWSRTVGLPVGETPNVSEPAGVVDVVTVLLEAATVLVAARLLMAKERHAVGRLAPVMLAVAALAVTTAVITSDDAATHNHAVTAAPLTAAQQIDADRCDKGFNDPSYWKEAKYLGIDTRWGGKGDPTAGAAPAAAGDGHAHSHGAAAAVAPGATTTTTEPDPLGGRGSEELDGLISATSTAGQGEGAAAQLVIRLGQASEENYQAWLWWLRDTGALNHAHDSSSATASGDSGGHGGHVGPQPWVAMTDQKECDRLASELARARAVTEKYPTAQDAMDAGWVRVTTYVPGIAAHYMKFKNVDGKFDLEQPEMILYDGDDPDAHVVGLSYYINLDGSAEPTQGFTGANDHGHRHVGLCVGAGGVIGDSTLTDEECAARGGRKANGSNSWMSHVWVVPGCESPWGVFSAASPILDKQLGEQSGKNAGGCAGSAVRERYGLDDPSSSSTAKSATSSSGDEAPDDTEGASPATAGN